jgi:hypothetical protein
MKIGIITYMALHPPMDLSHGLAISFELLLLKKGFCRIFVFGERRLQIFLVIIIIIFFIFLVVIIIIIIIVGIS